MTPQGTALGDAGGAAGSALPGQDYLTELGITNTGEPFCINDALTSAPGGYHQLCLGANSLGAGVLSYNAYGGASPLPLQCNINGVVSTCLAINPQPIRTCANIMEFGGVPDGTTDNTSAFNLALASFAANPCVYLPAGDYSFASQLTYNLNANDRAYSIYGDGPDTTKLIWPSAGGIRVNGSANRTAFHVRDLSLLTGGTNAGIAFDAEWNHQHNNNMGSSTIERVRTGGIVSGAGSGQFWSTDIKLNGVSQVNINSLDSYGNGSLTSPATAGIGIDLEAPSDNLSFIYNISSSNILGHKYGLYYGSDIQGVSITGTNFVVNGNGIYSPPNSVGQSQLAVVNSQFDDVNEDLLVDTGSTLANILFSNNLFFMQPGSAAIRLLFTGGFNQFLGNQFDSPAGQETAIGIDVEDNFNLQNIIVGMIDNSLCLNISTCIKLGRTDDAHQATGWRVSNTKFGVGTAVTSLAVENASTSLTNVITGFISPSAGGSGLFLPQGTSVTGAVANGSGGIRLTVPSTANLINNEVMFVSVPNIANTPGLYTISIVDGTHVDLIGSAFAGSFTTTGTMFVMP